MVVLSECEMIGQRACDAMILGGRPHQLPLYTASQANTPRPGIRGAPARPRYALGSAVSLARRLGAYCLTQLVSQSAPSELASPGAVVSSRARA